MIRHRLKLIVTAGNDKKAENPLPGETLGWTAAWIQRTENTYHDTSPKKHDATPKKHAELELKLFYIILGTGQSTAGGIWWS